jgi:uncharacterized protein (DUF608 family)
MKSFYLLLIFFISSVSVNGQDSNWPILKHYNENHISKVALPVGGIGTGTVSISGRGNLVDWEIMNRPGKGFSLDFWDDFSDDGRLIEKRELADDDPMASLAVQQKIPANGKKVFQFFLKWHFPNRKAWSNEVVGNYYTTQYNDAWEVISKTYPELEKLEQKTLEFVNAFLDSDFPEELKEAALFNLSTLRSQTVFRIKSGHMMGWEGCMDRNGSYAGSCTHVWNYEQATAFLFGDLAKTMRDVEFNYATRDNGSMAFRTALPLIADQTGGTAADGQMGTIMKMYRDWQLSGDTEFLKKSWPKGRPKVPFPYFSEVMTGFEYAAAVGMLYEGMEEEGLQVIRNIRARYDGAKRSPFNEAECGHHYARAMASWASVLALTGFQYSALGKTINFKNQVGKWFWSNGYAWGTCEISEDFITLSVNNTSVFL